MLAPATPTRLLRVEEAGSIWRYLTQESVMLQVVVGEHLRETKEIGGGWRRSHRPHRHMS